MNRLIFISLFIALLAAASARGFTHLNQSSTSHNQKRVVITVSSTNSEEEITFDASYLFRNEQSTLKQVTNRKTPFWVDVTTDYIAGIFRKKSGEGDLVVSVNYEAGRAEDQGRSDTIGKGAILIIGTEEKSGRFSVAAIGETR